MIDAVRAALRGTWDKRQYAAWAAPAPLRVGVGYLLAMVLVSSAATIVTTAVEYAGLTATADLFAGVPPFHIGDGRLTTDVATPHAVHVGDELHLVFVGAGDNPAAHPDADVILGPDAVVLRAPSGTRDTPYEVFGTLLDGDWDGARLYAGYRTMAQIALALSAGWPVAYVAVAIGLAAYLRRKSPGAAWGTALRLAALALTAPVVLHQLQWATSWHFPRYWLIFIGLTWTGIAWAQEGLRRA